MEDFLKMTKSGKVYLFGDGNFKLNPSYGDDLAKICINAIKGVEREMDVGGPDTLTQNEIAKLALQSCGKPEKISHLPDWIRRFTIWTVRTFTSSKTYRPFEFFLTTMNMDMVAPQYGAERLEDFFNEIQN